jgi:hypothetical protein
VMRAARIARAVHHRDVALVRMRERSRSARPARRTSLFGNPALRRESQKSPFRRCFKPRPPWRAGCAGSPPAADRMSKEVRSLP